MSSPEGKKDQMNEFIDEPPKKSEKEKQMNSNTIFVLNQILKDGLKMLGDSAESKGMLGEDVVDHHSAEYLAKSWGLDWINKTPEEVEAEEKAAAEAAEEEGEGGDDEDDDDDGEVFGHRTGFREPPFAFEYGFNPLIALGEFIRMRHPRVRLRRVVGATRAFCLNRSPGVRAVTFVTNSSCSVEATASAAKESLQNAKKYLDEETSKENSQNIASAQAAVAVAEAVHALAAQSLAASQAAGGSDKDVSKMIDPTLGPQGKKQAELLAAELASHFTGHESLHKRLAEGLETQRKKYLIKRGLLEHGPFDLVVSAPLSACLETSNILAMKMDGTPPTLVATPLIAASAVASKNEIDPKEKKDALLASRKGKSPYDLEKCFPKIYYDASIPPPPPSSPSSSRPATSSRPPTSSTLSKRNSKKIDKDLLKPKVITYPKTVPQSIEWDFKEVHDGKHWKCGHHEAHKPGWFNPSRLNGHRCDDALDYLTNRVEKHILVVGQSAALVKMLGVPSSLFHSSKRNGNGNVGGIVRRLIGSEFSWSCPFILAGRKGELPLTKSLITELLPHLSDVDKYRGFVGFALHFEHSDNEVLTPGADEEDDAPINLSNHYLTRQDAGYENFGRIYEVKGSLHITWANQGFADECEHRYDEIKKQVDSFIAHAAASCAPNPAAVTTALAKAQSDPNSAKSYMTKLDKWPASLPGQGPSLLSLPQGAAVARAVSFIRLQFRTHNHAVQGRKAYREKIVENVANEEGFVQAWIELDEKKLDARVSLLWNSVQCRDQAYSVVNEQYASVLAAFAMPGTLVISRGRTIVPNTLPDGADWGLDTPDNL
jgi:hypothetical protein